MAKGVKAAVTAAALGMGLLGAAGAARADTYDFIFSNPAFYNYSVVRSFNLIGGVASIFTGLGTASFQPGIISNFLHSSGSISSLNYGPFKIYGISDNGNGISDSFGVQLEHIEHIGGIYSGTSGGTSIFAELVAPTTSAPSGPSSGSAPSPEVNTLLGFLVVGGTVAFIKRRRKNDETEEMVAS